jgi:hypothetical protein
MGNRHYDRGRRRSTMRRAGRAVKQLNDCASLSAAPLAERASTFVVSQTDGAASRR